MSYFHRDELPSFSIIKTVWILAAYGCMAHQWGQHCLTPTEISYPVSLSSKLWESWQHMDVWLTNEGSIVLLPQRWATQFLYHQNRGGGGGGGVLSTKLYVDVPAGPWKSDYLYTNFLPNFPPISIPFLKEKHPIWIKLGAFYNNLPKIHPIYVIWAPSSLMKAPPIAIPNFAKKCPKRQAHIPIPCQCENPPRDQNCVNLGSIMAHQWGQHCLCFYRDFKASNPVFFLQANWHFPVNLHMFCAGSLLIHQLFSSGWWGSWIISRKMCCWVSCHFERVGCLSL